MTFDKMDATTDPISNGRRLSAARKHLTIVADAMDDGPEKEELADIVETIPTVEEPVDD